MCTLQDSLQDPLDEHPSISLPHAGISFFRGMGEEKPVISNEALRMVFLMIHSFNLTNREENVSKMKDYDMKISSLVW